MLWLRDQVPEDPPPDEGAHGQAPPVQVGAVRRAVLVRLAVAPTETRRRLIQHTLLRSTGSNYPSAPPLLMAEVLKFLEATRSGACWRAGAASRLSARRGCLDSVRHSGAVDDAIADGGGGGDAEGHFSSFVSLFTCCPTSPSISRPRPGRPGREVSQCISCQLFNFRNREDRSQWSEGRAQPAAV